MHSQNLPSNLVNVTMKPSNWDTRTFRRMFVPGGFETGVETGMEWRLVEVLKDEPNDWGEFTVASPSLGRAPAYFVVRVGIRGMGNAGILLMITLIDWGAGGRRNNYKCDMN